MKNLIMFLQIFDNPGDNSQGNTASDNSGNNGTNTGGTFTYEQLNEIATSRADRAEKAALKSFFKQNGLSEEEAKQAFDKFKADRDAKMPDMEQLEQERDKAVKELEEMKNNQLLMAKGVKAEDIDYVSFKVKQLTDDKTDFTKAADKFLKDNPKFTAVAAYRVTSGTGNKSDGSSVSTNDSINSAIRAAMGR